jgi:nucleoside-diphosphate-sugar epimerase
MSEVRNVLVTGGAGYIGSALLPKLIGKGYRVTVLDSLAYSDAGIRPFYEHERFRLIVGDIRDAGKVRVAMEGQHAVVHLAAISNDPSAELDARLTQSVNLEAYAGLLSEAKRAGVRRFINSSSIGVYGINFEKEVTENDSVNPLTEYARCKVESEKLVRAAATDDFVTVSLRCGTVCGWSPRMRFDLSVNTLTAVAMHSPTLTVWGGEQSRPQIHIDDITRYFVELLHLPGEKLNGKIFNAAGQNVTVMQIATAIRDAIGKSLELVSAPPRADERSYRVDSGLIRATLGLFPQLGIKEAIQEIVDAHRRGLWTDHRDPLYNNVGRLLASKVK